MAENCNESEKKKIISLWNSQNPVIDSYLYTKLCIMFKIIVFFIIKLFIWLYVRIGIVLLCRKHMHNHIISLRGEIWAHITSLPLPLFIEVPVTSQECERSCICVLVVLILLLSTILILDFGNVLTV